MDSHTAAFWAPCPQHRTAVALAGSSWEAAGEFCITALTLSQVRLQRAFLWSFPSKLLSFSDYPSSLLQFKTNFSKGKILRWCRRNKGLTEVLQQVHSQREWLRMFFFLIISARNTLWTSVAPEFLQH